MKWLVFCVLAIVVITMAVADGEIWEEDDHEVLIRSERGAKNRGMFYCKCILYALSSIIVFVVISFRFIIRRLL